jgi:L-ascorbate metabolism protein UlaG (beta-lactamase superfamily)
MKASRWIALSAAGAAVAGLVLARRGSREGSRLVELLLPAGDDEPPRGEGSIEFVGTATTIVRYGGFTILTDPNFLHRGERVHLGYGLHSTRLTEPAFGFAMLPEIDFVVLSHLHEDHFDRLVERRLDRSIPILTPPAAARALRRKGFRAVCPLDTWDAMDVRKGDSCVRVTAMPGTHGPLALGALLPPVMGSMLEFKHTRAAPDFRLYISGDTLVHDGLYEIPLRYPDIHLALLHLGGTRVLGVLLTMDAEQGVRALRIVAPKLAIPIHYNDYDVFKSPLEDFRRAVEKAGLADRVRYLGHGDTFRFTATGDGIAELAGLTDSAPDRP